MRSILALFLVLALGTAAGLAATWWTSGHVRALGAIHVGPWTAWPRAGSREDEPYGRAWQARSGDVPLGAGEGLALHAETDSAGRPLDAACEYAVTGRTPTARIWTLTLSTPEGQPVATPLGRAGLSSEEVLRTRDGAVDIRLSRDIQPGDWLQLPQQGRIVLALRLYDSGLGASAAGLDPSALPAILRTGGCAGP